MLIRTIDRTIRGLNQSVTEVLACDDCRREAPETLTLGGTWGDVAPYLAAKAGFAVRFRGSLRVTLCPDCCRKHDRN